jgi:predicted dehydrogenase
LPWGGLGLYGDAGVLEVLEVDFASAYPLRFEVQGGNWDSRDGKDDPQREFWLPLTEQRYLQGDHLHMEEPHVYADIMDLVDAIGKDRQPHASGEQARHVIEIVELAQAAAQTGLAQIMTSTFPWQGGPA